MPWAQVGPGWLLVSLSSHGPSAADNGPGNHLFLLSPAGDRLDLGPVPPGATPSGALLADWSADGRRALFAVANAAVEVVGLADGRIRQFGVTPGGEPRFSQPGGLSVLVSANPGQGAGLRLYELTGNPLRTYPTSFPDAGRVGGDYAQSPYGDEIAIIADNGIEVMDATGAPIRLLRPPSGAWYPRFRWRSDIALLAGTGTRLYEVPVNGSTPMPLTADSGGPVNYTDAWVIKGTTYLQAGVEVSVNRTHRWVARLNPDGTATPMAAPDGQSVDALGVFQGRLAVIEQPDCDGPCGAQATNAIGWYNPATGSFMRLLGAGVNGGWITSAYLLTGDDDHNMPTMIYCGAEQNPQAGYNLDYIDESGSDCELALQVALFSLNFGLGAPYSVEHFTCSGQPGPTSGQYYVLDRCTNGAGGTVIFKSRTP